MSRAGGSYLDLAGVVMLRLEVDMIGVVMLQSMFLLHLNPNLLESFARDPMLVSN